ncbi:nitrite reductase large subunit NirB [Paludibacterium sp. B53371]|uniref:nitrite reductase large subunit NirB n=1 Tax=Paludibacterium sp. B53371 TaxID=2806263 RepID=UPI001C03B068|nr:nitrite reductase large subunit NirB [Paludibacterium sp. B53371]
MSALHVVVVGNGMVGQRFLEELVDKRWPGEFKITVLGAEPRAAYDRVHLSSYFAHHTDEDLALAKPDFYQKHGIRLCLGEAVRRIDRAGQFVETNLGQHIPYDKLILATGSYPWVPPIEGAGQADCFVYRTIDDLQAIERRARQARRGVVIGGGLLGLEAAGALKALGLETHVVEFAPVLMAEQLDRRGGEVLRDKIVQMGVHVHTGKNTREIVRKGTGLSLLFAGDDSLDTDLVVFSTGIRPQDTLARYGDLAVAERGGIVVNDHCQTDDPAIYAIGECASWQGQYFGLVAPGYRMAQVVADHLMGVESQFAGADMSAKLKLLGVSVGSIGDAHGRTPGARSYVYQDDHHGIYKKLVVSANGQHLLGAVLVGDVDDYGELLQLKQNAITLPEHPDVLILPAWAGKKDMGGALALPASAVICSCFDVSKARIAAAVADGCRSVEDIKKQTRAGTGCGGCVPLIHQVLQAELATLGIQSSRQLCEHFPHSRQDLFHLIKAHHVRHWAEALSRFGQGYGCEICKPAVASILAGVWNDPVLRADLAPLQDTNDAWLGNLQKDGSYSVIPRMPGGEVTPAQLAALAAVAERYQLYTKVTGAQRIGLFGARKGDLPAIWAALIAAGFESGQAYAKSLRMVKTCVGSTWCRFGVQDSVGLGVMLEHRYKGLRTPHKLKFGVSGCTRECAEAQGKDVGVIATDRGWNLYVGGNGGMKPRHAELLAADLDQATLIRYIDRFVMWYVQNADKLQRTASWIESLDHGIEDVRRVVVADALGLGERLEAELAALRAAYACEWQRTLQDPGSVRRFADFINSDQADPMLQYVAVRDQHRPATPDERRIIPLVPVES